MKFKKIILVILIIAVVICLCTYFFITIVKEEKGYLKVNDTIIKCNNVLITSNSARVPFVQLLLCLGADIKWENDNTADITFKGIEYVLSLSDKKFTVKGSDYNYLLIPPGCTTGYSKVIEKDIILDIDTIRSVFCFMEYDVKITIDRGNSMVNITAIE